METATTTTINHSPTRRAAINGLAVVGFVALVFVGIGLAVYTARFVPSAFSSASVYLSSLFTSGSNNQLQPVTDGKTIPFDQGGAASIVATSTQAAPAATTTAPIASKTTTSPGAKTSTMYTQGGTVAVPVTPHGLADLAVTITAVGYLLDDANDTFIATTTIPSGKRAAVKFTVTNKGTNVSGAWQFTADIPTSPSYTFTSSSQQSLNPNDRIDYVLGFDRARSGDNRTIDITVDSGHDVTESNESNNEDTATVNIN